MFQAVNMIRACQTSRWASAGHQRLRMSWAALQMSSRVGPLPHSKLHIVTVMHGLLTASQPSLAQPHASRLTDQPWAAAGKPLPKQPERAKGSAVLPFDGVLADRHTTEVQ